MGRHSHQPSSPPAAAAESATATAPTTAAAAGRRSNPPRRARNAQSATAAQASALHSTLTRSSPMPAPSTSSSSSSSRARRPPAAASRAKETRRRSFSGSPEVQVSQATTAASSAANSPHGHLSSTTGAPASSTSFGLSSSGAASVPSTVSAPTESLQIEQDPITEVGARDDDDNGDNDSMDSTQLSALVAALGPVPNGWSVATAEPFHRFDKAAFAGAELPATLDASSRAKCLAFLQDPRVLRVTELEPSVEGLPCLSACVCPICGTLVKDNWVPSRSGGFRRQIRTESLKEHLGMRHHLLRRVKCPVQDISGCNCKGYCKAHRLLNHFSDNIGCLMHVERLLAVTNHALSAQVLSTMQWALGSDWPRAYDELANAAIVATGRAAVVDVAVQFAKCRELVLSRVAKSRKVTVNVVEQAIEVHRREQTAASIVGVWNGSVAHEEGQLGSAAMPEDLSSGASPSLQQFPLEVPSRTSTLDSLLAPPAPSSTSASTAAARSPMLVVTSAPLAPAMDLMFDQFQLQPMSPTASDGASSWSQGTSASVSTALAHQDHSMDSHKHHEAFHASLNMYPAMQSQQLEFLYPPTSNNNSLTTPIGVVNPMVAPIPPPGFVLPTALDTRTAPPHSAPAPHSNPHTPVQSPMQAPAQAPAMLQVPDWVQAHIPASVSPVASPAASPSVFATQSPAMLASFASPHASTTGLTPLVDQHLRFATTSPAGSPSMLASNVQHPGLGMCSPSLLASPAFLGSSMLGFGSAGMSPCVGISSVRQPAPSLGPQPQQQRTRIMHFVPTPDNLLVDGVYIGPVGPSVAVASAAAGGSAVAALGTWPEAGIAFTTVADALDMRHTRGNGYS
ncbi:hypothetical protein BCR44DRAFT_63351 [Catenaria anguillulae PL171]|uniref:Uncharacterized protein n=1 Tax=Catenaria anguillulae PL171 TaxID=765915 RepID=A0A1Y2HTF6_9FUNG|nr:hypothetical protein BCR44DRAFT_63351 [Catenaria anguillulae PL171]